MLYLDLFCVSVSKMYPKVIESSLQLTKGFMGTLYFQVTEEICTYVIKWHRTTHT